MIPIVALQWISEVRAKGWMRALICGQFGLRREREAIGKILETGNIKSNPDSIQFQGVELIAREYFCQQRTQLFELVGRNLGARREGSLGHGGIKDKNLKSEGRNPKEARNPK